MKTNKDLLIEIIQEAEQHLSNAKKEENTLDETYDEILNARLVLVKAYQYIDKTKKNPCSICKVREDMGECERLRKTNRTSECSEFRRIKDEKTKNMA